MERCTGGWWGWGGGGGGYCISASASLKAGGGEGAKWGGMAGWSELGGGGGRGLGHRHFGSACLLSQPARLLESGALVGLAGPWDLGSCVGEHMTCQPLVGNFRQPEPPGLPENVHSNLKHQAPPPPRVPTRWPHANPPPPPGGCRRKAPSGPWPTQRLYTQVLTTLRVGPAAPEAHIFSHIYEG